METTVWEYLPAAKRILIAVSAIVIIWIKIAERKSDMKRFQYTVLCVACAFLLAACESKTTNESSEASQNNVSTVESGEASVSAPSSAESEPEESSMESSNHGNSVEQEPSMENSGEHAQELRNITYEIMTTDFTKTDGVHTIECYISLPYFTGDAKLVNPLNEKMDQLAADYAETYGAYVDEELEMVSEWDYSETFQYSPTYTDSVYIEDSGIVSIGITWDWYMGGVFNKGYGNVNYNLLTGEEVTLEEYLGVDRATINAKIVNEVMSETEWDVSDALAEIQRYSYYFDGDYVYICFGSYELDMGTTYMEISLGRDEF